jgi:hypothetical protein
MFRLQPELDQAAKVFRNRKAHASRNPQGPQGGELSNRQIRGSDPGKNVLRNATGQPRDTADERVAILAFCRDPMTTVWIYADTKKEVGDVDHLKVFANEVWIAAVFLRS